MAYQDQVFRVRNDRNVRPCHCKALYLKDCEQRVDNRIKVRCRSSFREVELTSEELHSKQCIDEDKYEEKKCDVDKRPERFQDDTDYNLHLLKSSEQACHSKHSERSEDSDGPESLE